MTPAELWTLIQSDATASTLAAAGNDSGCAERCGVIAPLIATETKRAYRGLASTTIGVGPVITRRLIVTVRAMAAADPLVDEMQTSLRSSSPDAGIDVADVGTQALLDAAAALQVPNGLTAEDAAAIKSLGMHPQTFTYLDISAARESQV